MDVFKTLLVDSPTVLANGTGLLQASNNLSDVDDVSTARDNLGIVSGVEGASTNVPQGFVISDGSTTDRAERAQYGAIGDVAGLPATFVSEFDAPASNPGATIRVWYATSDFSTPATVRSTGIIILSSGSLQLRTNGAPIATDYTSLEYADFITDYAGQPIRMSIAFPEGNSATDPTIIINGVDKTSSFTRTTGATAENWMDSALVPTYFLSGFDWPEGRAPYSRMIIGTVADADAASYTRGQALEQAAPWTRFCGSAVEATSGTLEVGRAYVIKTFQTGDDFTNVGAGSNASGVQFVATGTTPTTWSNSSALVECGPLDRPIYQPALATDDAFGRFSRRLVGMTPVSSRSSFRVIGNTDTSGNEQILSGAVLDDSDAVIDSIEFDTDGTPTITLGSASGGAQYVASTTLSAGLNADETLVTRKAASTSLWVGSDDTSNVRTYVTGHKINGV